MVTESSLRYKNCVWGARGRGGETRDGDGGTEVHPREERHCTPKTFPIGTAHACLAGEGRGLDERTEFARAHTHAHGLVDFPIK